jgi:hypothetical protein
MGGSRRRIATTIFRFQPVPTRPTNTRPLGPVDSNGANDRLAAFVHMNMLNPNELRAAVSQAAQGFYLDGIGTQ